MREQKGVSFLRFVSLFPHYQLKASKESEKKIKKKRGNQGNKTKRYYLGQSWI